MAGIMQAIASMAEMLKALSQQSAIPPPPQCSSPQLDHLCRAFRLSEFEKLILLLLLGMELEPTWASLCAQAQQDPHKNFPTFQLAIALSPAPDWSCLAPSAPLRYWKLIELGASNSLTTSPLRLDERILHYLLGVQHLDERLMGILQPIVAEPIIAPSHLQIAEQMTSVWRQFAGKRAPILQICGEDTVGKRAIAVHICEQLGLRLQSLNSRINLNDSNQLHLVQRLCEREYILANTALLLDCDFSEDSSRDSHIVQLADSIACPVIITSRDRRKQMHTPILSFDIPIPSAEEQHQLWETFMGDRLNGFASELVSYFHLSPSSIQTACLRADLNDVEASLWTACRLQARPRLDELSQRIESHVSWSDLILPEKELGILQDIASHVRQRMKVYDIWGMGSKSKRGLGVSALFAGASGTGKTLAAEVLGNALELDVYRIDLSAVVSKYIGETEKNLRRIFDSAEGGGVILLFDEADALFGKRSEVKDSHDRHANIEVSYLLQRMEAYRGLAILTTNLKSSLDQAFLRRLRFVVQFPFPDTNQRMEIWRRAFPPTTPTQDLDFQKLAKLNVAGGNIRNMALNAAFLAADADEPVQMKHILQSAKVEYMKMERPMTDSEIKAFT